MRIEKINDRQIRCTLNQKDLEDREIHLHELTYATDKAKALFRDMMQQASYEFGFETENIPLMIEAIPMFPDALVLLITKVEDPEELDTRFSQFTEEPEEYDDLYDTMLLDDTMDLEDNTDDTDEDEDEDEDELPTYAIFNLERNVKKKETDTLEEEGCIQEADDDTQHKEDTPCLVTPAGYEEVENDTDFISLAEALGIEPRPKSTPQTTETDAVRIYQFTSLESVCEFANVAASWYHGNNTLYKIPADGEYLLTLHKTPHTAKEFNVLCNIAGEYGAPAHHSIAANAFLEEHCQKIIVQDALATLRNL